MLLRAFSVGSLLSKSIEADLAFLRPSRDCTARYTEGLNLIITHGAAVAIAVAVVVGAVVTEAVMETLGLFRGCQHTERHGRRVRVHLHVGEVETGVWR